MIGGLTLGDLASRFSQHVRNKYPKSYTKNGGPVTRPFSAISKKPELALRNLLSTKYMLREREDEGGRIRCPKRSRLRKYLPHAVPGQWSLRWLTVALPPFSNGVEFVFSPEFHCTGCS